MKTKIISMGMLLGLSGCQGEGMKGAYVSPISDTPQASPQVAVVAPAPDPSPSVAPAPSPTPTPSPTSGVAVEISHLECHYHHLQQGMYYDYTVYNYSDNTKRVGCRATNNPAVNPMYKTYSLGDTGYTDLECDYASWFFSSDGTASNGNDMKADHYNMGSIDKTFLFAASMCTSQ